MMAQKYRKKPAVIEAVQVTRSNVADVAAWCGGRVIRDARPGEPSDVYVAVEIPTLEGTMRAETFHPATWDGTGYTGVGTTSSAACRASSTRASRTSSTRRTTSSRTSRPSRRCPADG